MLPTTSTSQQPRVLSYDMARGIGIILVVIGHSLPMDTYARALVYSFHIPLFFFISGSVMKPFNTQYSIPQTIHAGLRAERKLFIFYLFYSICFLFFDIFFRVLWLQSMDIEGIFWDIDQTIMLYGINVLWFLITLPLAKVITRVIAGLCHSLSHSIIIALLLYLGSAFIGNLFRTVCTSDTLPLLYNPVTALIETLTMTSFVLMGYTLRNATPKLINSHPWTLTMLFACNTLLCFQFGAVDYHMLRSGFPPLSLALSLTGILGTLGVGTLLSRITVFSTALRFYSKHSLFIMITHEYLLIKPLVVVPLLTLVSPNLALSQSCQVIALLILEIPICLLFQKPCEHIALTLFRGGESERTTPRHARQNITFHLG